MGGLAHVVNALSQILVFGLWFSLNMASTSSTSSLSRTTDVTEVYFSTVGSPHALFPAFDIITLRVDTLGAAHALYPSFGNVALSGDTLEAAHALYPSSGTVALRGDTLEAAHVLYPSFGIIALRGDIRSGALSPAAAANERAVSQAAVVLSASLTPIPHATPTTEQPPTPSVNLDQSYISVLFIAPIAPSIQAATPLSRTTYLALYLFNVPVVTVAQNRSVKHISLISGVSIWPISDVLLLMYIIHAIADGPRVHFNCIVNNDGVVFETSTPIEYDAVVSSAIAPTSPSDEPTSSLAAVTPSLHTLVGRKNVKSDAKMRDPSVIERGTPDTSLIYYKNYAKDYNASDQTGTLPIYCNNNGNRRDLAPEMPSIYHHNNGNGRGSLYSSTAPCGECGALLQAAAATVHQTHLYDNSNERGDERCLVNSSNSNNMIIIIIIFLVRFCVLCVNDA